MMGCNTSIIIAMKHWFLSSNTIYFDFFGVLTQQLGRTNCVGMHHSFWGV